MSSSNCCFLTCIQVSQGTVQVVWYSHLLKNFPQFLVIHTVKGFDIVKDLKWQSICWEKILACYIYVREAQAGIKIAGGNINNLRYTDDPTLMAESGEELKRLLMKVKEESEKVGLKLNSQKTKTMASGPIIFMGNRWRNSGNSVRLYFFGAPESLQMVIAAMKLKDAYSLEEKLWPT